MSKDESSNSNRSLVLPASIVLGAGSGLGYRHFMNKAEGIKDEIKDLKASIPELNELNPRYRKELDDLNAEIAESQKGLANLRVDKDKFEADKALFTGGHAFPDAEEYKRKPAYYDDTSEWFNKKMSESTSAQDDLLERAKKASDSIQANENDIAAAKNKLETAKKNRGRAILKGRALGLLGAGLVGGGLIHAMSQPRERR